jgi:hypothetical protein
MTKHRTLLAGALAIAMAASGAVGAQFNFGGDLGFWLFDVSRGSGIQPNDSLGNRVPTPYPDTTGRINTQFGPHGLGLYWNVQLTDQVSANILTEVGATTGATPSLGSKLGTQFTESGTLKALTVPEANISVMLPWQVQMTTGIIRPIFSVDYGEKKGYQEANRLFKSSANTYGGAWHDLGVELYKSFEPGCGFSIPAYAYVLAGEQEFGDNNNNKMLLFHVAPGYWKLNLLGSYGFGKEDPLDSFNVSRYAAGLAGDFSKFWFRTEFFGGSWQGAVAYNHVAEGGVDTIPFTQKPMAYYVKAGYNFIPDKLGLVLTYDQYSPDWTTWSKLGYSGGGSNMTTMDAGKKVGESYTTVGATIQYWVIPGSSVLLEYDRAMWKAGDGTLCKIDFNRFTLGWRTVF